jgi:hypothetical protein
MPKQSLKNPKFRCNHCKEYHSAPEHMTMYQCASHGYLCEKCVVTENSTVELFFYDQKSSNREVKFPEKYIGNCNLDGNRQFKEITYRYSFFNSQLKQAGLNSNSKDEQLIDFWRYGCLKKTIRYDWDNDNNLWVEEGTLPKSSNKSTAKSTNLLLLIELFENDSISKEDFIKTIKSQLK